METIIERITGMTMKDHGAAWAAIRMLESPIPKSLLWMQGLSIGAPFPKELDSINEILGLPSPRVLEAVRAMASPAGLAAVIGAVMPNAGMD